jgi:hypothetical protein
VLVAMRPRESRAAVVRQWAAWYLLSSTSLILQLQQLHVVFSEGDEPAAGSSLATCITLPSWAVIMAAAAVPGIIMSAREGSRPRLWPRLPPFGAASGQENWGFKLHNGHCGLAMETREEGGGPSLRVSVMAIAGPVMAHHGPRNVSCDRLTHYETRNGTGNGRS